MKNARNFVAAMLCGAAAIPLAASAASSQSETILTNGRIYTAADSGKWAEAIAISGDHIDAVGTNAQVTARRGPKTKVVDLHGSMVIPGITDNHVHIWFGSLALNGFNLSTPEVSISPDNPKLFIARLREVAASHHDMVPIIGRAPFNLNRTAENPGPDIKILDEAVPDRPLIIHHTSEHALFVNTKALEMAGITNKPLPDPDEEMWVDRDAQGHPTGIIKEAGMEAIERALPPLPLKQQAAILAEGEHFLNGFGITSVVLATGGPNDLEAYAELRREGKLTLRMRQAFAAVSVKHHLTPQFLSELEAARAKYHDDWISANMVKFFMDGLRTEPLYTLDEYTTIIKELDRRGFQIMTHALSAPAAKRVLDGYEAVERASGPKDRRWRMEHAGRVDAVDLPRFAKLGAIPSMQPAFCCQATGGPSNQWNTLLKSGARLEFSSDWPCSWPPNPLLEIQQATMRYVSRPATPEGPLVPLQSDNHPEERITAEQALLAYTRTAAFANKTDAKLGTLEAGKLADLVVLSQNILEVPNDKIASTLVKATIVGGKVVYGDL